MKANKKRSRIIALFLTGLLLFQSCVVYYKTPTTLEKASRERVRTRITAKNGDVLKYRYISVEDGMFYGMNQKSGKWIKTPLDQNDLALVQTRNKSGSTWATVALIGVPVIVLVIIGTTLDIGPGDFSPLFEEM
jgi:hypothetical protein